MTDRFDSRLVAGASASVLMAAVVYAHWPALVGMEGLWSRSPMYSYGYTVPFISLYLLWWRRAELTHLEPRPARLLAAPVIGASCLMLLIGHTGGLQVLQQLSFIVAIVAVVLVVFGVEYLKAGWAAIAYLLLMIPIWDVFTEPLHPVFQTRSAEIGAVILGMIGVPVHLNGTILTLPNVTLEVARACSGVNYLVAVLALGLPLAYLSLRGIWRRVVLVIGAVIVAACSNGLRVALIGLFAYLEVGSPLHGPLHVLHGLFVAAVGYVALFAGVGLLSRTELNDTAASDHEPARLTARFRIPVMNALAVSAVFVAVGAFNAFHRAAPVPLTGSLNEVPLMLGSWSAEPGRVNTAVPWLTGADAQLARRYRKPGGYAVDVYVGYFTIQQQDKEVANFRTADLHRRARKLSIPQPGGRPLLANLVDQLNGRTQAVLFWYDINGVEETSQYRAKIRTLWNILAHGRSNGAVVALVALPETTDDTAQLQELAGLLRVALADRLPRAPGFRVAGAATVGAYATRIRP